jgi:hypothetical protein
VFFIVEFLPNLDLKNTVSPYTKDFSWEKRGGPNTPDFKLKKFQITRVL